MSDEYGVSADDLKGGGGGNKAKPTGVYTGTIEDASIEKDKNGKLYAKFRIRIAFGKFKNGVLFENYLPLSVEGNKFNVARRNSFVKALGLKEGARIPGTPGAAPIKSIEGTYVDVTVEHEYENVPGQEYSVTTRKGKLPDGVSEADVVGIEPRERLTWYAMSDEFEGLGSSGDSTSNSPAESPWG